MNDSIRHHKLIPSTVVAFVTDSPEPYSVSYGLILINRNQLIGEKVVCCLYMTYEQDFSHIPEFHHLICLCLAFQYYGILIQPLTWSDSWICMGISSFLGMKFMEYAFGKETVDYLTLRFRDAAFFIEDLIAGISTDQGNRSTIMNNRPLAAGNGAVFSNSPFLTPLFFVKSPIVISLISQQCGESYFYQLLHSMIHMCYQRLEEQSTIHQAIVTLLPLSKLLSKLNDSKSSDLPSFRSSSQWIEGSVLSQPSLEVRFPEPSAKRVHTVETAQSGAGMKSGLSHSQKDSRSCLR